MISQLPGFLFCAAMLVTSVLSAVTITKQPEPTNVPLGRETYIEVQADGQDPLLYKWFRDGTPIEGATQSFEIIVVNAKEYMGISFSRPADMGKYEVCLEASSDLNE
jgi:hypothetical protein